MTLSAIETQRLYQKVATQLAELMRTGYWKIGDRLPPERELAARLQVSRPTVREAMVALELAGLIEIRTGSGIFVRANEAAPQILSQANGEHGPLQLIQARRVIEGEVAALAARQITGRQLGELLDAIEKMERDIDAGVQALTQAEDGDWLFHVRLSSATGNEPLQQIVSELWAGMRLPMFRTIAGRVRLPVNARRAAQEHRRIHAALSNHDPDAARTAMHEHLDQVERILLSE